MRVAAKITPFWHGTGGHAADQAGAHNLGYLCLQGWVIGMGSDGEFSTSVGYGLSVTMPW